MSTTAALPNITAVDGIVESPQLMALFRHYSGFCDGVPPANCVTQTTAPDSNPFQFKGWTKTDKHHPSVRRRLGRALNAYGKIVHSCAVLNGLGTDDEPNRITDVETGELNRCVDVYVEMPPLGLIRTRVDAVMKPSSDARAHILPHTGQTSLDDAWALFEFVPDLGGVTGSVLDGAFVKLVAACLSRERVVPIFVTDLCKGAVRLSVSRAMRGFPLVSYDVLSMAEFDADLRKHALRKSSAATAALAGVMRQLKGGWCAGTRLPTTFKRGRGPKAAAEGDAFEGHTPPAAKRRLTAPPAPVEAQRAADDSDDSLDPISPPAKTKKAEAEKKDSPPPSPKAKGGKSPAAARKKSTATTPPAPTPIPAVSFFGPDDGSSSSSAEDE